jgi:acetaldehyde dehydrogenase (acetylating)
MKGMVTLTLDKDLAMIQEVRDLVRSAQKAREALGEMSQEKTDAVVKAMCEAGAAASERLARMAEEETGIGRAEDKILKNLFATKKLYEYIADMKTAGVISKDPAKGVCEIAVPMGVAAAVTPTTNPTSTAMNNAIIALKSRNAIVISPHPRSRKCTFEAAEVMRRAAVEAGAPEGCVGCIANPGVAATDELMKNPGVDVIIATGGPGIVKAAYSSGKPAFGVGAGNAPCYIEKSADVAAAVRTLIESKSFDNGTICASEQSVVCDREIESRVKEELRGNGGYFMNDEERLKLEKVLFTSEGGMTASTVGRSAKTLSERAGFSVPEGTRVLIGAIDGVGQGFPLSHEKLCPVLAFYTTSGWREACELSIRLLELGGLGHTMAIHSTDEKIIMEFALRKPAMRVLVNTASSLGGVGGTTGLFPALTLGCGTYGGNIISDNLGPLHLVNRKRLAYGLRDMAALKSDLLGGTAFEKNKTPALPQIADGQAGAPSGRKDPGIFSSSSSASFSEEELVRTIVARVYEKLRKAERGA